MFLLYYRMPIFKRTIRKFHSLSRSKRTFLTVILTRIGTTYISCLSFQMWNICSESSSIDCYIFFRNLFPFGNRNLTDLEAIVQSFNAFTIQPCHIYKTIRLLCFCHLIFTVNSQLPIFFKEIFILYFNFSRCIISIRNPFNR